jgi:hypothetical protein
VLQGSSPDLPHGIGPDQAGSGWRRSCVQVKIRISVAAIGLPGLPHLA